jgi:hypothetical protein
LKQQFSQEEGTSLEDLFLDLTKDAWNKASIEKGSTHPFQ